MTDIVERLRKGSEPNALVYQSREAMREAADEIERLRADIKRLRTEIEKLSLEGNLWLRPVK